MYPAVTPSKSADPSPPNYKSTDADHPDAAAADKPPDVKSISLWSQIFFGMGCISRYGMRSIRDVYSTIFLLEVAELPPSHVAILAFVSKLLEALFDLIIGIGLTRMNTRFGKYKPFIMISAPFVCVTFVMLWYVPTITEKWKLVYYVGVYGLFYAATASFNVPYLSLTVAASNSHKDFEALSASRTIFQNLGTLLGLLIIALILEPSVGDSETCGGHSATPSEDDSLPALVKYFLHFYSAYIIAAVILGVLHIMCSLVVVLTVKDLSGQKRAEVDPPVITLRSYREMIFHKPFVYLAAIILCTLTGYTVMTSMYSLYYRTVLNAYGVFPQVTVVLYFAAMVAIPISSLMYRNRGRLAKANVLTVTLLLYMLSLWLHIYLHTYIFTMSMVFAVLLGLFFGVTQFLPQVMIMDAMGPFREKYGDGLEFIIYVITECFSKLGEGLCVFLSTVLLQYVGYISGSCDQPESVAIALRLIFGCVPTIFFAIAIIVLWESPGLRRAKDK